MTIRALTQVWTQWRLSTIESSSIARAFVRSFVATSTSKRSAKKEKEKTEKAKTPRKDPKPRQLSPYTLFFKEVHKKLRNAGIRLPELSRQAGKEWSEMSKDRQQKYVDEANRLNASLKEKREKEKEKGKSEPTKRSTNAYIVFLKAVLPTVIRQHPEKSFGDRMRIVGEMWRNLSPEEKARRKEACAAAAI